MTIENNIKEERYKLAQKRVEKLRGFYNHLIIFLIINIIIVFFNYRGLEDGESYFQWHNFMTLLIWGFFLLLHAVSAFIPNFVFGAEWEERKIKQYMDDESQRGDI